MINRFFLGILFFITVSAAVEDQERPQAILFDSTGVLFKISMRRGFMNMGPSVVLSTVLADALNLRMPAVFGVRKLLNEYLSKIPASEKACALQSGASPCLDNKGERLSSIYVDILLGHVNHADAYSHLDKMTYRSEIEKKLVLAAAKNILPDNFSKMLKLDLDVVEVIKELKANGFRVGILTNYGCDYKMLLDKHPGLEDLFDGNIFISSQMGVVKPSPMAYIIAANGLGVSVSKCVMVDDQKENVEGACNIVCDLSGSGNLGMKSVLFTSASALRESFVSMGLLS